MKITYSSQQLSNKISFSGKVSAPTLANLLNKEYTSAVLQCVSDSVGGIFGLENVLKVNVGGYVQMVDVANMFNANKHLFSASANNATLIPEIIHNACIYKNGRMYINRIWLDGQTQTSDVDFVYNVVAHEVGHAVVSKCWNEMIDKIPSGGMWNEIFADYLAGIVFAVDNDLDPKTRDLNPNVPICNHKHEGGKETGEADLLDGVHPHSLIRAEIFKFGYYDGVSIRKSKVVSALRNIGEVRELLSGFADFFYNWIWTQYNTNAEFKLFADTVFNINLNTLRDKQKAQMTIFPVKFSI